MEAGRGDSCSNDNEDNDLAAKKVARNMGRRRGSSAGHNPNNIGLAKSRILGSPAGREAADKDYNIMGDLA